MKKINILFWFFIISLLPIYILFSNTAVNSLLLDQSVYHETYAFHTYQHNTFSFLNENEISHMYDVRQLLSYGFVLLLISLNYIIYQKLNLTEVKYGAGISLILFTSIFIWAIIDFNSLFTKFHELFFTDNWLFEPNSNIKTAYPNIYFSTFLTLYYFLIVIINLIVYKLE